ncbi:unnamed protein product [Cercopithifilaria johnstoni]|uniref:Uncharacterized protein n=1 Tax=Cercopithifilaria johnstoni TaxID=2874296 RepID=A0A8J2MBT1_9BILA|nr:unnamed protein product [Cercopithifilaria johnstoni]
MEIAGGRGRGLEIVTGGTNNAGWLRVVKKGYCLDRIFIYGLGSFCENESLKGEKYGDLLKTVIEIDSLTATQKLNDDHYMWPIFVTESRGHYSTICQYSFLNAEQFHLKNILTKLLKDVSKTAVAQRTII